MKIVLTLPLVAIFSFSLPSVAASSAEIEERELPHEIDMRPQPKIEEAKEITFEGYVNSRNAIAIAEETGYVYNLCEEKLDTFCGDEQGLVTTADKNAEEIIEILNEALKNGSKVRVKFLNTYFYGSQRKIIHVEIMK